jgi:hypothetical protein
MKNQVVRVNERVPLSSGLDGRAAVACATIGTTRFLGGEDGPWVYYSERPAGAEIPMHQHRSGRTEFLIEGEIAFRFAEPPADGSPQETVYGANTLTYVRPGVVYGYTVLRDSRILISFDAEPGINYV